MLRYTLALLFLAGLLALACARRRNV